MIEPPAVVPVSVLIELADEFESRSKSGQIVHTEAEGNAMRRVYREVAVEIRRRIPQ